MRDGTKQAILEHAKREYPRESCGLVTVRKGREAYIPCRNAADTSPGHHFIIDGKDYAAAEEHGDVVAVVHSHVGIPPTPSQADLVSCEQTGLLWVIVNLPTEQFYEFKPTNYVAPLLGRTFHYGVLDCYSLARDYYKMELGIELPDFDRNGEWWLRGEDVYMQRYPEAGFQQVPLDDLRKHDLLLIQLVSRVANHIAIYLGDNIILHHVQRRLSCREMYGGYWTKNTRCVLRHKLLLGKGADLPYQGTPVEARR